MHRCPPMIRCTSADLALALAGSIAQAQAQAQAQAPAAPMPAVLFENVRVFDGVAEQLTPPSNVLVVGNRIAAVSRSAITDPAAASAARIAGNGRTLMPGLIDAHTHIMFAMAPMRCSAPPPRNARARTWSSCCAGSRRPRR